MLPGGVDLRPCPLDPVARYRQTRCLTHDVRTIGKSRLRGWGESPEFKKLEKHIGGGMALNSLDFHAFFEWWGGKDFELYGMLLPVEAMDSYCSSSTRGKGNPFFNEARNVRVRRAMEGETPSFTWGAALDLRGSGGSYARALELSGSPVDKVRQIVESGNLDSAVMNLFADPVAWIIEYEENQGSAELLVLVRDIKDQVASIAGTGASVASDVSDLAKVTAETFSVVGTLQQIAESVSAESAKTKDLQHLQDTCNKLIPYGERIEEIQRTSDHVSAAVSKISSSIDEQTAMLSERFGEVTNQASALHEETLVSLGASTSRMEAGFGQVTELFYAYKTELQSLKTSLTDFERVIQGGLSSWVQSALDAADQSVGLVASMGEFVRLGGFDLIDEFISAIGTYNKARDSVIELLNSSSAILNAIDQSFRMYGTTAANAVRVEETVEKNFQDIKAALTAGISTSSAAALLSLVDVIKPQKKGRL